MYESIADAYDRLDEWIVENWGEKPPTVRADFLRDLWAGQDRPVRSVLEVCCGTGLVLEQVALRGFDVTGLDGSREMLQYAAKRLGSGTELFHSRLPRIPHAGRKFDAVISSGAAFNYMSGEEELARTFRSVAGVLRPGGSFVFDILSRKMMEEHCGSDVWAADLGEFAFIWTFANAPSGDFCDATYTQFLRLNGDAEKPHTYSRSREEHRLHTLDRQVVRAAARSAGLVEEGLYDNYALRSAHADTLYETWSFVLPG